MCSCLMVLWVQWILIIQAPFRGVGFYSRLDRGSPRYSPWRSWERGSWPLFLSCLSLQVISSGDSTELLPKLLCWEDTAPNRRKLLKKVPIAEVLKGPEGRSPL